MTHTWTPLEGESLAGDYRLQQCLGGDDRGAFFVISLGSEEEHALVKLVPEEHVDAREQLALWRRTIHLEHPNLLRLYESGRSSIAGEEFLYALFEQPDERLSAALHDRPLNEFEVRDVLAAAIDALRYLHAQGLVHTSLDPDHIVAVGDRIKLATDTLRESGDSSGASHTGDVAALGALAYELLTRRRLGPGLATDWSGISGPLQTIIQHATDSDPLNRWTLAEIDATLKSSAEELRAPVVAGPEPVEMPVDVAVPVESLAVDSPAIEASTLEPQAIEPLAVQPTAIQPPARPPAEEREPARPARRPAPPAKTPIFPRWIYFGVGALLLLILALNVRWRSTSDAASTRLPPAAPPAVAPSTPVAPSGPVTPPAAPVARERPPVAGKARPSPFNTAAQPQGRAMWRLIAYTYATRPAAEKKARSINEKWPDLHARVFLPAGGKGLYLVALGGRMTREDAVQLQKEARAKGLPRDIYVQNYQE